MADLTQTNEFSINGKILHVGNAIYISEKLSKRTAIMEVFVDGKFKQEVAFDFVNDNMNALDKVRIGDWVSIDFVLRGRKNIQPDGKARWFTNNEGKQCTMIQQGQGR